MRLPLRAWTHLGQLFWPTLRRGRRARKGRALAGQRLEARALLDGDPWISVSSAWVTAPGSLVFTIDYSNLPDGTAISYSTDGGMPGTDYSPVSGSSAASGSGSFNVTVSTFDHGMGGTDYVSLNASGGGASAQGVGSIDEPSGGGGGGGSPTDLSLAVSPTPLHTGDNAYLSGSFNDSDSTGWFTTTVDWGDGMTDTPSTTGTGFYDGHTYTEPGTFTVAATVTDQNGQSTSDTTAVTVSDPTLAIQGFGVSPSSADAGNQIVATGNITGIVFGRNYFETIDWGDGTTDNVSDGGNGNFQDNHVYANPGGYTVTATVADDHDRTASATASEKVSDPSLAIQGFGLSPVSTDEGNQVYASGNITGIVAGRSYTEAIDWGDGTVDNLSDYGNGQIQDNHVYLNPGDYAVIATIADDHDRRASATAIEKIDDQGPSNVSVALSPDTVVEHQPFDATVSFSANPIESHTVVVDWGDGHTSTASAGPGMTSVDFYYQYDTNAPADAAHLVTATVTDSHGESARGTATANVVAPAPHDVVIFTSFSSTSGMSGGPDITHVDLWGSYQDPAGMWANDTVSVDWGDGHGESFGANTGQSFGTFGHDYAAGVLTADYTITVTVTAPDGNRASASTGVTVTGTGVNDAAVETITITAPQPQALEKSGQPAQLVVTRSSTGGMEYVDLQAAGTATAGADYNIVDADSFGQSAWYGYAGTAGQGTVVFPPGVSSVTLDIVPIDNQQAGDPNRTMQPSLAGDQSQYVLGNPPAPTVTIVNDNVPNVGIQADPNTADAASGAAGSLVVSRDGSTNQPLTVSLVVAGTATPNLDYAALPTSVTIAAGSSSASIAVRPIHHGALDSLRQSFVVPVAAGGTYTLTLAGDTTAPLAHDADAASVQAGLEALAGVGAGNVLVVGSGTATDPFVVAFAGALAYVTANGTLREGASELQGDGTDLVGAASVQVEASPPDSAGVLVQMVSLAGATGGTFTLNDQSDTTSPIAWNASADDVAAALSGLPGIGEQVASVTGDAGGPWAIAFQAGSNVAPLAADNSQLTGSPIVVNAIQVDGSPTVDVSLPPESTYDVLTSGTATVTIAESFPPEVGIVASTNTADEHLGTAGEFTVSRIGPDAYPLAVNYSVSGSATNYQPLLGQVVIPAGERTATIDVVPTDAFLPGPNQTVTLTLLAPADNTYTIGPQSSDTVTILEDDPPQVSIQATQPLADEVAGTPGVFTVARHGPTDSPLTVVYSIGGTATNYQGLSGSVTIAAGQSSATIDVTPLGANLAGPDQPVTLTLSLPDDGGYVIGSPSSDTVVIAEDAPPGVTIAATTPTADEQTGSAGVFTVTRNSGLANDLAVAYSIGGTAVAGAQFQQLSGTVVIPAGQASATIDVDPINVGQAFQPDNNPTVTLTLVSSGENYTAVSPSTDTVTIDEDADTATSDPSSTVTIAATQNTAYEPAGLPGAFTVSRTGATDAPLLVSYTISGTAAGGTAYQSLSGYVTIPAGSTTAAITIYPFENSGLTAAQTVVATLDEPSDSGYLLGTQTSDTVTIEGPPTATIEATQPYANEQTGDAATFTVSLDQAAVVPVTIAISLGGTAVVGTDFQLACGAGVSAASGSITIPAGQTSAVLSVNPLNAHHGSGTESLVLSLARSAGGIYLLGSATSGTATIHNLAPPTIAIQTALDASLPSGAGQFTVTRTGDASAAVTVPFTLTGTATSGTDYQPIGSSVTFESGQTSAIIAITPVSGDYFTGNRTVSLALANPTDHAYQLGTPTSASVTITGDELPLVSIVATQPVASVPGGQAATVTISRSGPTPEALTVHLSAGGPAVNGGDYQLSGVGFEPATSSLTIPAGSSTATLTVAPLNNGQFATTANFSLANSSDYNPGASSTATVTIIEQLPTVTLQATQSTADAPSHTPGTFTLTRTGPTTTALVVNVLASGTAIRGSDFQLSGAGFQPVSSSLTIPIGSSSATVTVAPIVDTSGANTSTVVLSVGSSSNYTLGAPATGTVTIDQDLTPAIQVFDGATLIPAGTGSDDFGATPINTLLVKNFSIMNTCTTTIQINAASLTVPSGFYVDTRPPSSLAPGATANFSVNFAPAEAGAYGGTASFADSDKGNNPYTFQLTATATPAQPEKVSVDGLRLVDDTGLSSADRVTSNPSVTATVSGWFLGGWAVVQFGDGGNVMGSSPQFSGIGTFTYDLRQDDVSLTGYTGPYDLQYRLTIYDAGGTLVSTGPWNDFAMTLVAPEPAPYVADFGLVNDTGPVSTPPGTYDPRVAGVVKGDLAGKRVDVQFDHNGDLTPFASVPGINTSGAGFFYDPSSTDPSLIGYSGLLTLDYRIVEHDSAGNVVYTSDWTAFNMTLYVPTPTVTVDNLQLADDTDPNSPTPASADPTVSGQVDGDIVGGTALLQFSNRGNGAVDHTITISQSGQQFTYDPRSTDTSLAQFAGLLPLAYRIVGFDTQGGVMYGDWISFPITVEQAASTTTIDNLHLVNATISQNPLATSDPTISGTVVGNANFGFATVQVYYNDHTSPDQTFFGTYNQAFNTKLKGLPFGQNTIHLRTMESPWGSSYPLYGAWTALSFDFEPPPPPAVGLFPVGSSANPVLHGTLAGGTSSANVLVEFSQDESTVDGETTSDNSGAFSYAPIGLNLGAVTLYARSVVPNLQGGLPHGAWSSVSFNYIARVGAAPAIGNLALANAPASSTSADAPTVSDPTITGTVTKSDGRADFQTINFYFNNDTTIDGTAITAADGSFHFVPTNLPAGPVTVNAQAIVFDEASQTNLQSNVASISFIYQPPASAVATITGFGLLNDLGADGGHAATDPTVTGQLSVASGQSPTDNGPLTTDQSVAFLTAQFDTNGDGVPDASVMADANGNFQFTPTGLAYGPVTIQARVARYDYATGGKVYSDWTPLTFTYEAPSNTPPTFASFDLASVTGAPSQDGTATTANPSVRGQVDNPGHAPNLVVEFFVNGQTAPSGYAWPDEQGKFIFAPSSLAHGPVAITASLRQWSAAQNAYVELSSQQVSFDYDQEATSAPALVSLSLLDANAQPTNDTTTSDPVLGGQLSYEGNLAGLTVQFDTSGGTTANASVVTNQYGEFTFAPVGLPYGTITIQARTQTLDASTHQLLTGPWPPFSFTNQPPPPAAPAVSGFQLASGSTDSSGAITATDPTVTGQVSTANATVQIQVNGALAGTTIADSQGNFSYTPQGLLAGTTNTIEVRAQNTDASGNTVEGDWSAPITFTLVSSDTGDSIGQLNLVDGAGVPIASLLTTAPVLGGQVIGDGPLSGITVELDTNGDGQPNITATTNAQGRFQFWPQGLPQGVVTVSARTSVTATDGTTTNSAWTGLEFVYTTNPNDAGMQALAAALVAEANSATTTAANFESGQAAAAATLQQSLSGAQATQTTGATTATAAYNSSASSAQATYAGQATAAESAFASAMQSYQDDGTSYAAGDFGWGSPPPPAQMPDDTQPSPPVAAPDGSGPTFDVTQDPGYQSAVSAAELLHDQQVKQASDDYQGSENLANIAYNGSLAAAASQLEQTLTSLATVTATNPYDVAAAQNTYNQTVASLYDDAESKIGTYQANYGNEFHLADVAWKAAWYAAWHSGDASNIAITQAYHDAWISYLSNPWGQRFFPNSVVFALGIDQLDVSSGIGEDAANEQYAVALALAAAQETQDIAQAVYLEAAGSAPARFTLSQISAQAECWAATSSANVSYSNSLLIDSAREAFAVAQAKAEQQLDDSLAKAARDRTDANADAESTLAQSVANADSQATAAWAANEGTASAQYQASLAADAAQFAASNAPQKDQLWRAQADADYAKAQAIDEAVEQTAEATAGGAQALADSTAKAARDRAIGSASATQAAALTDATAALNKSNAFASANLANSLTCAGAEKTDAIAAAIADEAYWDARYQSLIDNVVLVDIAEQHDQFAWLFTPIDSDGFICGPTTPAIDQALATALALAGNARDHAEIPAYLSQQTAVANATNLYDDTTRDAAAGLSQTITSLNSAYLDAIAHAQHDDAWTLAGAQHDLATSTAKADALDISLSATADNAYGDVVPGFQKNRGHLRRAGTGAIRHRPAGSLRLRRASLGRRRGHSVGRRTSGLHLRRRHARRGARRRESHANHRR
jgi:hypothetical protein